MRARLQRARWGRPRCGGGGRKPTALSVDLGSSGGAGADRLLERGQCIARSEEVACKNDVGRPSGEQDEADKAAEARGSAAGGAEASSGANDAMQSGDGDDARDPTEN